MVDGGRCGECSRHGGCLRWWDRKAGQGHRPNCATTGTPAHDDDDTATTCRRRHVDRPDSRHCGRWVMTRASGGSAAGTGTRRFRPGPTVRRGGCGGPTLGKRLARRPGRRRGRCCWWRFRCLGDGGHSLSVREGQNSVAHRRRKNRTGRTPRNRIGAQWGGTQAAGSIGGRHKRRERERKGVSRRERESDS